MKSAFYFRRGAAAALHLKTSCVASGLTFKSLDADKKLNANAKASTFECVSARTILPCVLYPALTLLAEGFI